MQVISQNNKHKTNSTGNEMVETSVNIQNRSMCVLGKFRLEEDDENELNASRKAI
jgi:hypothetical protein